MTPTDVRESPEPDAASSPDHELWERATAAMQQLAAAEADVEAAKREYDRILSSHLDLREPEAHVEAMTDAEMAVERAERALKLARNRVTALGDAVHPARVRAKQRQIAALNDQAARLREQWEAHDAKRREHTDAIRTLTVDMGALDTRRVELVRQTAEIAPRGRYHFTVSIRVADPYRPPAGVLVRASAWRQLIEQARADGREHVHIAVNESSGDIITEDFAREVKE